MKTGIVRNWIDRWFTAVLPASLACNAAIVWAIVAVASPTQAEDPRLDRLFRSYIAPCCWSASLAKHDSEASRQVRAQIETMVRNGRTDEEIKTALVDVYGKRVLAVPDGEQGTWLFATPFAVVIGGLGLVSRLLYRLRSRHSPASIQTVSEEIAPAILEAGWDAE